MSERTSPGPGTGRVWVKRLPLLRTTVRRSDQGSRLTRAQEQHLVREAASIPHPQPPGYLPVSFSCYLLTAQLFSEAPCALSHPTLLFGKPQLSLRKSTCPWLQPWLVKALQKSSSPLTNNQVWGRRKKCHKGDTRMGGGQRPGPGTQPWTDPSFPEACHPVLDL